MIYKRGDIILINFPFTSLLKSKKRPVLVIKSENEYNDFICLQVTSKDTHSKLYAIRDTDISDGELKLKSYIRYDKCFTLNSKLVDKRLASINYSFMSRLKNLFCEEI